MDGTHPPPPPILKLLKLLNVSRFSDLVSLAEKEEQALLKQKARMSGATTVAAARAADQSASSLLPSRRAAKPRGPLYPTSSNILHNPVRTFRVQSFDLSVPYVRRRRVERYRFTTAATPACITAQRVALPFSSALARRRGSPLEILLSLSLTTSRPVPGPRVLQPRTRFSDRVAHIRDVGYKRKMAKLPGASQVRNLGFVVSLSLAGISESVRSPPLLAGPGLPCAIGGGGFRLLPSRQHFRRTTTFLICSAS